MLKYQSCKVLRFEQLLKSNSKMCDFYHSKSHEFRGPEDPSKNTIVQLEGKKKSHGTV